MDKQELITSLSKLDSYLSFPCDIVLVGGAAMILYFGASRATRDIDMLVLQGNLNELHQAVKSVAEEQNLPEDWMNDAVKGFTNILPPDFYNRLIPLDFPFQHLRLHVLGRPEQVALKIVALREQDLEDLEILLPQMSETDREVLIAITHHVNTSRPDWAQKIQYFLQEQGWQIE